MPETPATKFAARLARLVNSPDEDGRIRIEPWLIEREIIEILIEPYYLAALVGGPELGMRMPRAKSPRGYTQQERLEAEVAAAKWLEHVLDRSLKTHARRETHTGHQVFLDLVRQGEGIATAEFVRKSEAGSRVDFLPAAIKGVFTALRRLEVRYQGTEGPVGWARQNIGPLFLVANQAPAQVIERMSLWNAIECAPKTGIVRTKRDMDTTVNLFRQAVETTAKHWSALLRLKLSPPDWMEPQDWEETAAFDTLNTNQAMEAANMLSRARAHAAARGSDTPTQADFQLAWADKPLSSKITFEAFLATPAGRAIVQPMKPLFVAQPETWTEVYSEDAQADDLQAADEADMFALLDHWRDKGALSDAKWELATRIAQGDELEDILATSPSIRANFSQGAAFRHDVEALFDELKDLQATTTPS